MQHGDKAIDGVGPGRRNARDLEDFIARHVRLLPNSGAHGGCGGQGVALIWINFAGCGGERTL
jgi:hypothetical protein